MVRSTVGVPCFSGTTAGGVAHRGDLPGGHRAVDHRVRRAGTASLIACSNI